jgi:hypothetical protein
VLWELCRRLFKIDRFGFRSAKAGTVLIRRKIFIRPEQICVDSECGTLRGCLARAYEGALWRLDKLVSLMAFEVCFFRGSGLVFSHDSCSGEHCGQCEQTQDYGC